MGIKVSMSMKSMTSRPRKCHKQLGQYMGWRFQLYLHLCAQGLAKLLADNAPGSFKETKFDNYFGRRIAVDASMHIYQFLVRSPTQGNCD